MREASTGLVYELAKIDKRVMALTSDGRNAVYDKIRVEMPNQYMDYGIAEQNMVASAAGLSICGKIPFIFGTSNFLAMRAFEFIRNDVCIPNMNVKFLGIFSGLSRPSWGATHQGTEEIALLRCLPNMTIITPSTPIQAREATRYAYKHSGPVYIMLEASGELEHYNETYRFRPGKGEILTEIKRDDVAIITTGSIVNEALETSSEMKKKGINIRVVDMPTVDPLDTEILKELLEKSIPIITLEEHSKYGGLGTAVAEYIAASNRALRFKMLGLDGCARGCGSRESVRCANGISRENLLNAISDILKMRDTEIGE